MLWPRCRLLLLLHRLLFLRLLMPFWIVPLLSWTGCGRIFLAPTLAWWPGAWSWLQDGFAPTLRFGRRWSRPRRLATRRSRPSLKAARDAALGEVVDIRGRCKALEDELQGLQDQLTKEVRLRQEQEEGVKAREAAVKEREVKLRKRRDRLGALEQELGARKAKLDDEALVLAEDRVAFAEMEAKARSSLRTLYDSGLESPLAGAEDGPAKLLPFLVRALEDVALGLGPAAEAEARVLSSAAMTRVLTHIYLRDPGVDLDSLLEPVSGERAAAAAEAVKGRAEALLGKFRAFSTKPKQGAADPAAP